MSVQLPLLYGLWQVTLLMFRYANILSPELLDGFERWFAYLMAVTSIVVSISSLALSEASNSETPRRAEKILYYVSLVCTIIASISVGWMLILALIQVFFFWILAGSSIPSDHNMRMDAKFAIVPLLGCVWYGLIRFHPILAPDFAMHSLWIVALGLVMGLLSLYGARLPFGSGSELSVTVWWMFVGILLTLSICWSQPIGVLVLLFQIRAFIKLIYAPKTIRVTA